MPESLIECPHCGLVQQAPAPAAGHALACARCAGALERATRHLPWLAVACAALGGILLLRAVRSPLFELHLLGRFSRATVMSGPAALDQLGMAELGWAVIATMVVAPLLQLLSVGIAAVGAQRRARHPYWYLPLSVLHHLRSYAMLDVYLLAALVCYVRLDAWADVEVGQGILSLVAILLLASAGEAALDERACWSLVPLAEPRGPSDSGEPCACPWCGLVARHDGARCRRCSMHVRSRKRSAAARSGALLLTAAFLCVPANALPVMIMNRFGRLESDTIFSGVLELIHNKLWALAALIFTASIVVPCLKLVALSIMLIMTARKSPRYLRARTRVYRFVNGIGRWSLVDVFAVAMFVSLVNMGKLAAILPGWGAVAFCAVVFFTMLATEAFDPRLMWDAAGRNGPARLEAP